MRAVIGYRVCMRGHEVGVPFAFGLRDVLPAPRVPDGPDSWCVRGDCGCVVYQERYEWMAGYYFKRDGTAVRPALGPAQQELGL